MDDELRWELDRLFEVAEEEELLRWEEDEDILAELEEE